MILGYAVAWTSRDGVHVSSTRLYTKTDAEIVASADTIKCPNLPSFIVEVHGEIPVAEEKAA